MYYFENFGNIPARAGALEIPFSNHTECQQLKSSILFQHILQLNDANKPFLHIIFPDDSRLVVYFLLARHRLSHSASIICIMNSHADL